MPIHVYWHDETRTILRENFVGTWSVDDFIYVVDQVYDMIEAVNHPVSIIADFTQNTTPLMTIFTRIRFSQAAYLDSRTHPNYRQTFILGATVTLEIVLRVSAQFIPRLTANIYTADSLEEALARIHGA